MKRFFLATVAALALICIAGPANAQEQAPSKKEQKEMKKQQKKQQKEMKKKISAIGSTLAFERAAQCIRSGNFVIEASRIQSQRGGITNVSSNTNFISVEDGESVVQIAPSNHIAGPNGVGGITVDGNVSNVQVTESKNGALIYSYSVQGIGLSATVKIQLPKGSAEASATVYPNYSNNEVTLHGTVVAPENSRVFKGRAL